MTYGLRHHDTNISASPAHENVPVRGRSSTSTMKHGSYNHDYEPVGQNGHGLNIPSGVLVSQYEMGADLDSQTGPQGGAAGYDLQGIGGQPIHEDEPQAPQTQGRVTRENVPLNANTHEGLDMAETDYGHPNTKGFRYRNKEST